MIKRVKLTLRPFSFGPRPAALAGRNANEKYSFGFDDTQTKFATYQRLATE
jgi:hypothetical protein